MSGLVNRRVMLACAATSCLRPVSAQSPLEREYLRAEGESLLLDIQIPVGAGSFPVLVYVHGGDFVAGNRKGYNRSLAADVLKRGIAWASVDYRLAPRWRFPTLTEDIAAAMRYLRQQAAELKVDPGRVGLMGESAGTLLVSYLAATMRGAESPAAAVGVCGTHDLVRRFHPEGGCFVAGKFIPNPNPGKPQFCMPAGISAYLGVTGPGKETERRLRRASPVEHVHRGMPPMLLLHGTHDRNAPFEQAVYMFEAMRAAGAPADLHAVDGGGHCTSGWDREPAQAGYREVLLQWLDRHLKGARI